MSKSYHLVLLPNSWAPWPQVCIIIQMLVWLSRTLISKNFTFSFWKNSSYFCILIWKTITKLLLTHSCMHSVVRVWADYTCHIQNNWLEAQKSMTEYVRYSWKQFWAGFKAIAHLWQHVHVCRPNSEMEDAHTIKKSNSAQTSNAWNFCIGFTFTCTTSNHVTN